MRVLFHLLTYVIIFLTTNWFDFQTPSKAHLVGFLCGIYSVAAAELIYAVYKRIRLEPK